MFTFEVNKNNIELTEAETLTSGSVNAYFCHFVFSSDWDGLSKTITFRAGDVSISILLDGTNMCAIPWEVLQADAVQLYAGARGTVTDTDTEEEAIIPTVYCLLGTIRKGTELGDNAHPPAPSVVDQIMSRIETLDEEKQDKLHGSEGQVVSFDADGNVITRDEKGTEYKAGENIEISEDNTISAKSYDDTEIRAEIDNVKSKTEANAEGIAANSEAIAANEEGIAANAEGIAKNSEDIAKNTEDISENASGIAKNSADIAKNSADIAKNTAGLKTVGDKVDTLTSSLSTLSKSVTDNAGAIKTSEENIAALSSSVETAAEEISKNAAGLSAANTKISELSASKQDKLSGQPGQVVGFDKDGNAIAQTGGSGTPGADGVTFTPMVSESGVLSWTNDGGRENPEAVNIIGPEGPQGPAGTYTAGENIEISEDGVISAKTYDDTALRSDISKNTASINSMKSDISANTSAIEATNVKISEVSSSLQSAKSDISANTSAIEAANTNISEISSSLQSAKSDISANTSAIEAANTNISEISSSLQSAKSDISANASAIEATNANMSSLESSKQDKLSGQYGQIVSFDENGNVIARDERGTEYKAGENIEISADNTISAKMYDDTEIRAEIDNVKAATAKNATDISKNTADISENAANIAKNATGIAKNAEDISKNSEAIAKNKTDISTNSAGIAKNATDISKNSEAIAKNTADIKTAGDKLDALTSSLSTISASVTDNTAAINTAEENIAALSSSVTTAGELIAKNASDISASNSAIAGLSESKQDKLTGTAGQFVGFDSEGNAIAQEGGVDGVTFTPAVSSAGIISWTNDGGRENPAPVNIKGPQGDTGITPRIGDNGHWFVGDTDTGVSAQGPQGNPGPAGTYAEGAGIAITNDTIALKDTASTKYQAGNVTVRGFGGFNYFTLNSQASEIRSIVEYLKTSSSGGEGTVTFRTMYGYAEISFSANRSSTLSPASALRILMSASVSYKGGAGFAIIDHNGTKYVALVYADSDYLYAYPTQTISLAQSDTLSIQLYVH